MELNKTDSILGMSLRQKKVCPVSITYPITELKVQWLNQVASVLILSCESVVILLFAVISKVINLTSVINS